MVADELLGALGDPRQVTHAKLLVLGTGECRRDDQPARVGQCARPHRRDLGGCGGQALGPKRLSARQIEAQEVAAVIGHGLILTSVLVSRFPGLPHKQ